MRHRLCLLCASLPLLGAAAAGADDLAAPVTALQCGHLLDVQAGKLLGETTVLIRAKRIESVVSGRQAPAGSALIDLTNATCLPGLIDSHTHLTQEWSATTYVDQFRWNIADYAVRSTIYARRTLLAGFTTVRNVGDLANESVALRNAINAGLIAGSAHFHRWHRHRLHRAAMRIATDGYRQDLAGDPGALQGVINSADDAVKAVRQHYKDGDDLIKIMPSGGVLDESASGDNPQLTLDEIQRHRLDRA